MKRTVLPGVFGIAVLTISLFGFAATSVQNNGSKNQPASVNNQQQKKEAPAPASTAAKKDVYTCPMHPEVKQDKPGKCPKCNMNLEKKDAGKITYTCPMHSEITKDKPGKCPKCGMDMVEKKPAKASTPK